MANPSVTSPDEDKLGDGVSGGTERGLPTLVQEPAAGLAATPTVMNPKTVRRYNAAFAVTNLAIGPVFGCAGTYLSYQLQIIGFVVGHNVGMPPGTGCLDPTLACRVPFGGSDVNLTSAVMFLNALVSGVAGGLTLLVCGWGDHVNYKRTVYIMMLVVYGALALPTAALKGYTRSYFDTCAALYTIVSILGFIAVAWQNIFVPIIMRGAAPLEASRVTQAQAEDQPVDLASVKVKRDRAGLKTSAWGLIAMNGGTALVFIVTIALTFANEEAALYGGLYMSTATAALCIVLALAAWLFLPRAEPVEVPPFKTFWKLPFTTFVDLLRGIIRYPEALKFLIGYTIYNDSIFALSTVTGTLFNLSVRPSLVEISAYTLVGVGTSCLGTIAFLYVYPLTPLTFRHWTMISYAIIAAICVWSLLGLSETSAVGLKHRAEFYVIQVLQNIATCIIAALFRVLYPSLFPRGQEIRYFGFQLVLGLGTTWIPQVVNGPIVDATNLTRLPAGIALFFFLVALGMTWWVDDVAGSNRVLVEEATTESQGAGP